MTVQELIDLLSETDRDALVNLYTQPSGMVGVGEVVPQTALLRDHGVRVVVVMAR